MRKAACLSIIVLFASWRANLAGKSQNPVTVGSPHVIEMTAKAYEFSPNEIHAKVGERVEIKLHTLDRAHGLKLNLYPDGASEDGKPGLLFDQPQGDNKVEKNKDAIIEFVASRPGTYQFKCSVKCSMFGKGHDQMTGRLVVDE